MGEQRKGIVRKGTEGECTGKQAHKRLFNSNVKDYVCKKDTWIHKGRAGAMTPTTQLSISRPPRWIEREVV
jgi:hypothetical protein